MLDDHWQQKKRLSAKVSWSSVDEVYQQARSRFRVLGGKVIGAGGGGFLLLYCPSGHDHLDRFMASHGMPRLDYMLESEGSKVVANVGSTKSMQFHPRASVAAAGLAVS